jgi:hypothetical protein
MRVSPILFSGPMVRAILREIEKPGTGKTQTRRILKPQPETFIASDTGSECEVAIEDGRVRLGRVITSQRVRFAVGDVLWVRETWSHSGTGVWKIADVYMARDGRIIYRADNDHDAGCGFFPSIHMPRKFSRLTLEVTGVKVERLHDISEAEAIAEGCGLYVPGHGFITHDELRGDPGYSNFLAPRMGFEAIWGEINGQASWEENPWVTVVSFRPHLINVDVFLAQREAA